MFSNLHTKPENLSRAMLFKQTIESTRKNSQFSNLHFVKISQKEFGEYKGSNEFHQAKDIFDSEPLVQNSGREGEWNSMSFETIAKRSKSFSETKPNVDKSIIGIPFPRVLYFHREREEKEKEKRGNLTTQRGQEQNVKCNPGEKRRYQKCR